MFSTREKYEISVRRNIYITFIARRYASVVLAVVVCPYVCPPVRPSRHKHRNDRTNRAGFGMGTSFRVTRKFGYLQKSGHFTLEHYPKLRTEKISSRQVDRVVNKSHRRRRQSSLLTIHTRQSPSRGCLLQVGQFLIHDLLFLPISTIESGVS